jgi:GntR family transcriptional regulator, carbon starvation induced regulator
MDGYMRRKSEAGGSFVEVAERRLQSDLLSGVLSPGSKLKIDELGRRYTISATPIREALSRLATRGLVLAETGRGFRATPISADDLKDILLARIPLETAAVRLSMRHGDGAWEGAIVAMLHQLKRLALNGGQLLHEGSAEFDLLHKRLHETLIAACRSPRLLEMQSVLYDQSYRYRRLMVSVVPSAEQFVAEHEELAGLVLNRDPRASSFLAQHIARTFRAVYPQLEWRAWVDLAAESA